MKIILTLSSLYVPTKQISNHNLKKTKNKRKFEIVPLNLLFSYIS